ncbi:MAG: heparinase II/III family protein [Clostridium sp.]
MNIFSIINLDYPGLENVKRSYEAGDLISAKKELREYFLNRKTTYGFIKDKAYFKDIIGNKYSEEKEKILKVAHDVMNKEFIFDLPWEMERCPERVAFKEEIDWHLNPFGDEEWTFMLNRHRYFYLIAQSYLIKEEPKYIKAFENLILDWIENSPLTEEAKKTSWRTIESGIRIKNWIKSLDILMENDEFSEEALFKMICSINEHLEYLHLNNLHERILSNWVILEQQGAFMAINYFPELKISQKLKNENIETLEDALKLQVVEDGFHWEQSFQYHNEMLNCYLEILAFAKNNNINISKSIKDKVYSMLKATLYTMKPNHCQSNYGDSDEEDVREILTLGALIFEDEILKNYGYREVDLNSLMIFGEEAEELYTKIKKAPVDKASKAFEDCGLYFMRSGFGEKDSYSMFKCGFLGSGHGHSDLLHLEVSYKGEDVLIDSGRYTYCGKNPLRIKLKQPISHNTNVIDNEDFTICTSSWGNNGVATPIKGFNKLTTKYDFVEGGHLGYINSKGTFVNRKVVYIKPGIWITSDEFITQKENNYSQFYNFNLPNIKSVERNKIKYCGENIDFYIKTLNEAGEFEIEESLVSKDYNKIYSSQRGIFNVKGNGNTFINTVMYGCNKGEDSIDSIKYLEIKDFQGKIIRDDVAQAIEINLKNKNKYIVLLVHREDPKGRKMYLINGHRVYGRVAVIEEVDKSSSVEVLAY